VAETPSEVFARRLRDARRGAGMSQAELARRVARQRGSAFDGSAITRIENQGRGVKLDEAVAIARALEMPLVALLVERVALIEEMERVREDLLVAEHARMRAASQAEEFAAEAERLRGLLQELESSLGG